MIERWDWICTRVGDATLGWSLSLPRDVAVVVVGVLLALVMLLVRRFATDQGQLEQIENDEQRLRELMRNARTEANQERLAQYWRVRRRVAGQRVRAEWIAMLVSIVILAAVIPWGTKRLEYLPIHFGEGIQFVARFPASYIGEVAHLVPVEGITATNGLVQFIEPAVDDQSSAGKAEWRLQFGDSKDEYPLTIRLRDLSLFHSITTGTSRYEVPVQQHDGGFETEIQLIPYHPLGFFPALISPGIPGWLLWLSLVTGGTYWLGKRVFTSLF